MEITKISDSGLRIKTKTAVLGVTPVGAKTTSSFDGVLFLQHTVNLADLSPEGEGVVINGPGEYEIKGVKLTGVGKNEDLAYASRIEGMSVFIVKASSLLKAKDLMEECQVLILEADAPIAENLLAASSAQVTVLYGEQAQVIAKELGKENAPVSKYAVTKDKLPTETEVVVLG